MKSSSNILALSALLVVLVTSLRTLSSSLTVAGCGNYSPGSEELKETYDRQLRQLVQQYSKHTNALRSNITTLMKDLELLKREKDALMIASASSKSVSASVEDKQSARMVAARPASSDEPNHPCTNSDFRPPKNSIAMATFVTDMGDARKRKKPRADYTYGAAALIKSIQKHVVGSHPGDRVDLILLEIPTRRLPDADRTYLSELGWNICTVTPIEAYYKPFGRFIDQFNKFHLWNFVAYDKILYLDSDALVVGNIDPLLERRLVKRIGVTQDYFGTRFVDKFNMGVFLIHPNRTEFHRLLELQATNAVRYETSQAEQGFLNALYKDEWEEIGIEYNANMAVWAQKRDAWPKDPKILHITLEKPWQEEPPQYRVKSAEPLDNFLSIWIDAARDYGVLWDETVKLESPKQPPSKKGPAAAPGTRKKAAKSFPATRGTQVSVNGFETKREHSCTNRDFRNTHDRAVFTLLIPKEEKYITAARVLGTSVARNANLTDLVVLELSTNPIPPSSWEQLRRAGWTHKCTIEPIQPKKRPSPRFIDQFSKLRTWGMTAYKVAVYLDADTFVLGNVDELLHAKLGPRHKIGVTADFRMDYGTRGGEWADSFNMGVFVIHPDWTEYQRLVKMQQDGSVTDYEVVMAEQGWLNAVYKDSWKDIGMIYNANVAARADKKFKANLDDIRIVHYTTMKPWYNNGDPLYGKLCQPWADIQKKLV